jgi:GNAT superfamily N-acetyltransferase
VNADQHHQHHQQIQPFAPFQLRHAQPADFSVVAELFEALHQFNAELDPCFALADDWRSLLADHFARTHNIPQVLWLLAWQGETAVGLLVLETRRESAIVRHRHWVELVAIYVVPAMRGSRLAPTLVEYARDWTAAQGLSRLQLYVTASNERARAFYASCGLRPVQEIWRLDVGAPPDQPPASHEQPMQPEPHTTNRTLLEAEETTRLKS